MSRQLSEDITSTVTELIRHVTQFKESSEIFKHIEKHIRGKLRKADTMYFLNRKDIDREIDGMASKFAFHSFFQQASELRLAYTKYMEADGPQLTTRLNIIKFLLVMSDSPTNNFWKYPDHFQSKRSEANDAEQSFNWAEYLNADVDLNYIRRSFTDDDLLLSPSSSFSDDESGGGETISSLDNNNSFISNRRRITESDDNKSTKDFRQNYEDLLAEIQPNRWFRHSGQHTGYCMPPYSQWREANIAILWDDFLKDQVKGLIDLELTTVISEYKVIREIIWLLFRRHTSVVFQLNRNELIVKSDVTISSVRSPAFECFLTEFVDYINILGDFRDFFKLLDSFDNDSLIPITYRYYGQSLKRMIDPICEKIIEIEKLVKEQETTITLLRLAKQFKQIFEPIIILHEIHCSLITDDLTKINNHQDYTARYYATNLLSNLHNSLQHSVNKLEHDIRLTLYLDSLYYYLTIIDGWFGKNEFPDYTREFVIMKNDQSTNNSNDPLTDWQLKFFLQQQPTDDDDIIIDTADNDGVIKIMSGQILQIGRNIDLLRSLGNYDDFNSSTETIHEELVRRTLEKIGQFSKLTTTTCSNLNTSPCIDKNVDDLVLGCRKHINNNSQSIIDISDGFLVEAFRKFLSKEPKIINKTPNSKPKIEKLLFAKINKTTTNIFPTKYLFENLLNTILRERYTTTGLMVKNVLIANYKLDKQFEFLRHLYLFEDDLIFPFYRRLFDKMTNISINNWRNTIWFTSHLHDILVDTYPDFYKQCTVQVKDDDNNWQPQLFQNLIDLCNSLYLQYHIGWPLNIIITSEHLAIYREIFQFVLKLKWALYTLNHLAFITTDLKKLRITTSNHQTSIIGKLFYLRFSLINLTNTLQHYIFGFVFKKYLKDFELNFEQANNLDSLMISHADFIDAIYRHVREVADCTEYENLISTGVGLLTKMWNHHNEISMSDLNKCYKSYKLSYKLINAIVNNAVTILDY